MCVLNVLERGFLCFLSVLLLLPGFIEARQWWVCHNTVQAFSPSSAPASPAVDWTKIAKTALPAVVSISSAATAMSQPAGQLNPMLGEPFMRSTFRGRSEGLRRGRNVGSGVVVSSDGYVLTTYHVIEGAEDIRVMLADRRKFRAQVIGVDPMTDLAVLKLPGVEFPTLPLGNSALIDVAEPVLAIGNPFGLNQTVTMGIVSAVGRVNMGVTDYEDFIQTDAAINPGNSGGALVNACGELIGINTALYSTSGSYMGIGFAVPVNIVRTIFEQIRMQGRVSRGWLGIVVQELTPTLARGLSIPELAGLLVSDVTENGPAERAGLRRDDVIVRYRELPLESPGHFRNLVAQSAPGSPLALTVYRQGRELHLEGTIGERPHTQLLEETMGREIERLGMELTDLDLGLAKRLGLPIATQGVVVIEVLPGSPAEVAGLQSGDVISEVNRKRIHSATDFEASIAKAKANPFVLLVNREGSNVYVVLEQRRE
jgi:serine protease Do